MRNALLLLVLAFGPDALAAEFPTGALMGAGFTVERGPMKMTERDLHRWKASATIVKRPDGAYEITVSAHMQRAASTRAKDDKRVDVYDVTWDSATSGTLMNRNPTYRDDKTTFTIENGELVLKSWITRSQLWETHRYTIAE